jgi:hypothetical protein
MCAAHVPPHRRVVTHRTLCRTLVSVSDGTVAWAKYMPIGRDAMESGHVVRLRCSVSRDLASGSEGGST